MVYVNIYELWCVDEWCYSVYLLCRKKKIYIYIYIYA